ncbi:Sac3p SCDLUD_001783 [Saccharomycodes ludwigii]|uniref:Sac3p n=1 Tax=Saccharomycodes ludwigii TaxID=36035 RepID=UPI001E84ED43|nr:hypothetical protein SCDLUD_001783 [Saccharomycodes ludwigii]KAH3901995.1 hypothetical protein SCDLUD_001783 [Saccharomycodes ludwigii]
MSAFNGFTPVSSGFDFFDRNVNNQGNAHNFNNNRNNKINVSFKGKYKHLPPGQQLTRKKDSNKFNGTTNKNTRNNNLDSNNDYNKNYSNSNNKNKYSNNKKWNTYKKNDHNNQNNSPTRGNTPIVNNNNGQLSSSLTKKKKKKKIYFKCLSPDKEKQLGPLTQNIDPLDLGFRKNSSKGNNNVTGTQILREAPKFMLRQQPHYESKPFIQDSWDKLNQEKMIELETKNISDINYLYDIFKKMRESERTTMEKKGLVDKAEVAKDLTEAINFQGTCLDMCPIYERIRRTVENNVASYEKDQNTGLIDRFKAIKVFARPAASAPPPLPSDVRPPHILVKTLDYIVDNLIQCLPDCESFVWDRMRSIRQDFTYQNYCGPEAVNCNERIVRIHLLILHIMSKCDVEYSRQQELEQLQKALITLGEIYDEVGGENEAEFRAYALLSIIRDAEYDRSIQKLSPKIFNNDLVQLAIAFRRIISNSNFYERGYSPGPNGLNLYTQFFKLLNSAQVPFLLSSYLETYINEIRFYGFYFIKQATNKKLKPLPMSYLKNIFSFNSFEEINEFCEYYSIDVVDNGSSVAVHSLKHSSHLIPERKPLNQAWLQSVDLKLTKYTSYSALINSEISSSFAFNANTNFNSFNKFKEENQLLVDTLDDGVERNSNNDVMVKPQSIATTTDLFGNSNNGNRELDKSSTLAGFAPQPPANTTNFNTNIPNINFGTAVESGMITTKNEGIGNDFGFNMDAGNNVPQTGMTPSTNIVPSFNNVLPQFTDSSRDSSQRIDNNTNSNPLFQSIKATNMSTSNILPQLPATSTTFETTSLNGSFPNIGNKGSTLSGKQTDHNDFLDNKDIINIENKKNEKNKLQVEKELEGKKKKKGKEEKRKGEEWEEKWKWKHSCIQLKMKKKCNRNKKLLMMWVVKLLIKFAKNRFPK